MWPKALEDEHEGEAEHRSGSNVAEIMHTQINARQDATESAQSARQPSQRERWQTMAVRAKNSTAWSLGNEPQWLKMSGSMPGRGRKPLVGSCNGLSLKGNEICRNRLSNAAIATAANPSSNRSRVLFVPSLNQQNQTQGRQKSTAEKGGLTAMRIEWLTTSLLDARLFNLTDIKRSRPCERAKLLATIDQQNSTPTTPAKVHTVAGLRTVGTPDGPPSFSVVIAHFPGGSPSNSSSVTGQTGGTGSGGWPFTVSRIALSARA